MPANTTRPALYSSDAWGLLLLQIQAIHLLIYSRLMWAFHAVIQMLCRRVTPRLVETLPRAASIP